MRHFGYSFWAILGLMIGIMLESGIYGIIGYFVRKAAGMHVINFKYLFFSYTQDNGFRFCKFAPIFDIYMTKEELSDEEDRKMYITRLTISAVFVAAIAAAAVVLWILRPVKVQYIIFLTGIAAWAIISTAYRIILGVKFYGNSDKMLFRKTRLLTQRMINGEDLADIDIPDYRTLGCTATPYEIVIYQCYAFMKLVWTDDLDGLAKIVYSLETNMKVDYECKPAGYTISMTPGYYNLLYYYCAVHPDRDKAEFIYGIIGADLKKDKDANGLRVLAYYTYYMERNEKKAYKILSEAIEALPYMEYRTERLLEDKLINKLIPIVNDRIAKNYPTDDL